jgi:hypothetical protein
MEKELKTGNNKIKFEKSGNILINPWHGGQPRPWVQIPSLACIVYKNINRL